MFSYEYNFRKMIAKSCQKFDFEFLNFFDFLGF